MFIGTLTNVVTVLIGTTLGVALGSRIPERLRTTITAALGLITLALGVRETLASDRFILVMLSVLVGSVIGELLRIEQGMEWLGLWLQERIARRGRPEIGGGSSEHVDQIDMETDPQAVVTPTATAAGNLDDESNRFAAGFVIASLVFCIGPLTILGSINDGLGDPELLIIKAALDGFAAIAFAAVYGWGVGLAALTVLVVQGSIALLANGLEGVLTDPMIDALASAGGILLLGIAMRLLDLKRIRVANMLPALVIAPLLVWVFPA